jgi:hypothetical protein
MAGRARLAGGSRHQRHVRWPTADRIVGTDRLESARRRGGITFRPQFETLEVTAHSVIGADHFDQQEIRLDEVDLVVDVSPEMPDETLYFALKRSGCGYFGPAIASRRAISVTPFWKAIAPDGRSKP